MKSGAFCITSSTMSRKQVITSGQRMIHEAPAPAVNQGNQPAETESRSVPHSELNSLPRTFFTQSTEEVARELLGRYLVLNQAGKPVRIGKIVETEAYVGEHDLASHSAHGRTARTAPMFEEAGRAYVYLIYGMYWCLNVVTEEVDRGCAVLLRALEPISGITASTDGPGKLCRALDIDKSWNRADLVSGQLRLTEGKPIDPDQIATSGRIGVSYAGDWADKPLRFFVTTNPYVSRYSGGRPRTKKLGASA